MNDGLTGLTRREALGYWLNEHKLTGEGAEIGVCWGWNASNILSQWDGKRFYMVDPWSKRPSDEYLEHTNEDAPFEQWYKDCCAIAERYPIVKMLRMTSLEAAKTIKDGKLDWCYIDAAHDYRNVLQDLDAWWSKVRHGGLFGGHDFYDAVDPEKGIYNQVESALKRWAGEHALSYTITPCSSWWIRKS